MSKKIALKFVISLFLLLLASPVFALKPVVVWDYEGPDDLFIVDCGDYDVRTSSWAKITITDYLDKYGEYVRTHVLFKISDAIYYNSENPEIYIMNKGAGNGENESQWWDADGNGSSSGMPFRIMLPKIGKLFMVAGHAVWEGGERVSRSGLEIFPEDGTGSKLCEALAP